MGIDVYYCVDYYFGGFDYYHEEVMFGVGGIVVVDLEQLYRFRVRGSRS